MNEIIIEIHHNGQWHQAAHYRRDRSLNYDIDYAVEFMGENSPVARVGLNFDINFEEYSQDRWPAFLYDIIPAGAARSAWLNRKDLIDTQDQETDWTLLCFAANSPPGNIRIASAVEHIQMVEHLGFSRDEIIERQETFIEYAEANNAIVAGASSVQGQAPKFLLNQDLDGRWHAEGALPEEQIQKHWLVKFPRNRSEADRKVLRNEAPYYEVARAFGLKVGAELYYEKNALFIERFDRHVESDRVIRYGLESVSSLCNWSAFGPGISHNEVCRALLQLLPNPQQDIIEYLRRDVLNIALGNVDNHGRNTAVLKTLSGMSLSPLFDFAPMFIDPEGIPRAMRWDQERAMGLPDWGAIADEIACCGLLSRDISQILINDIPQIEQLSETMAAVGVERDVIERRVPRINDLVLSLKELRP
jgi:serine/threonine-protein kinase HipA